MKCTLKLLPVFVLAGFLFSSCNNDDDVDSIVENFNSLPLTANSYWNGSDMAGSFKVNGVTFPNKYTVDPPYSYWSGFAYSNMHDVKTAGYLNQYSSYAMSDTNSTNTFVVAYPYLDSTIIFDNPVYDVKFKVTNNTYAALSMKYGDSFVEKFDSIAPDWFKLTVIGLDASELPTDTANIFLADYRFASKKQDYIVDEWLPVNLSKFGEVKKLKFILSSSRNNDFGMITPGFFCLDDLEYKLVSSKN